MKLSYRILAWILCILVMLQAASHAWFSAAAAKFLSEGGTLDLSNTTELPFTGVIGVIIHSMSGMYLFPLVVVVMIVVGYLTRTPRAAGIAVVIAVLIAVQITLGLTAPAIPALAFLHGFNALLIFLGALYADHYMRGITRPAAREPMNAG